MVAPVSGVRPAGPAASIALCPSPTPWTWKIATGCATPARFRGPTQASIDYRTGPIPGAHFSLDDRP
jgi:hypothetical protein